MAGRFDNTVALVTGASRGIGAAAVRQLAAEGAEVVAIARSQVCLEELDDEVRAAGGKPLVLVPHDLKSPDVLDQVGAAIHGRWGRLDVVIGAAGTLGGGLRPVAHFLPDDWAEVMAVNLTAHWRLIRATEPLLRAAPAARAVFLTDGAAVAAPAFWGPYGASKAALETVVRSWAAEIARVSAIRVNLFDPGPVATRLRCIAFPGEDQATLDSPEAAARDLLALCLPDCPHQGETIRRQPA
jgi:NAD(P)-dependent dehydrogenase (short-subunit alcohol dehydrogenase family)